MTSLRLFLLQIAGLFGHLYWNQTVPQLEFILILLHDQTTLHQLYSFRFQLMRQRHSRSRCLDASEGNSPKRSKFEIFQCYNSN
jgi:hypothetical protein